jgi:hypothetical protein
MEASPADISTAANAMAQRSFPCCDSEGDALGRAHGTRLIAIGGSDADHNRRMCVLA